MQSVGYLNQLLYFLVYSSSLITAAAVVVFRRKLAAAADIPVKRFIISIVLCCSLLSVQVFLSAVGFMGRLSEETGATIMLIFNIMIVAGFAAVVYSAVSISFIFRPAAFGRIAIPGAFIASGIIVLLILILQILLIIVHLPFTDVLLGYMIIFGTAAALGGIIFSTIRLFIPLSLKNDPAVTPAIRILFISIILLPFIFLITGNTIGSILAPAGFISLNIICMRVLYIRILPANPAVSPAGESAGTDQAAACRELGLSKRETDVALLLSRGASYKEIAAKLFISMSTTQTHVGRIYSKLDVSNKTQLSNLLNYTKIIQTYD